MIQCNAIGEVACVLQNEMHGGADQRGAGFPVYRLGSRSPLIIDLMVRVQVKKRREMLWVMLVYFLLSILGYLLI